MADVEDTFEWYQALNQAQTGETGGSWQKNLDIHQPSADIFN